MILVEEYKGNKGKYICELGNIFYGKITEGIKNPLNYEENKIYNRYVSSAKKRNKEFKLTKHLFKSLINKECNYCFQKEAYNGIDRRDNDQGYTYENSVPCCKMCNRAKHAMGFVDFDNWLEAVSKNYKRHFIFDLKSYTKLLLNKVEEKHGKETRQAVFNKLIFHRHEILRHQQFFLKGFDFFIKREDFINFLKNYRKYDKEVKVNTDKTLEIC